MNRKACLSLAAGVGLMLFAVSESKALSPETELLLELLQAKGIITSEDSDEFRRTLEMESPQLTQDSRSDELNHRHSVTSLAERVEKIEAAREETSQLSERIHLGGFVEVELSGERNETPDGLDESNGNIALAAAELDVDVNITDNVSGHAAFLYEDGENFTVDEGIISVTGGERSSVLFKAGKMYIPFGRYESHFVSDPSTLTLGETNDGALLAVFANDIFEVSAGIFNGAIDETGEDEMVDSFVGSIVYSAPESERFSLAAGISYTSNLASSDSLRDDASGDGVSSAEIMDLPGGFGAFLSASFRERFYLDLEFVSALEQFSAGDLAFDNGMELQPSAWNLELAYAFNPRVELAARYGGSNEFGSAAPEDQYGLALLYSPFDNTSIVGEYLHSEFEDDSETDSGTVQFAIDF